MIIPEFYTKVLQLYYTSSAEDTLSLLANSEDKQLPVLIYDEASRRIFSRFSKSNYYRIKETTSYGESKNRNIKFTRLDGYQECMDSNINVSLLKDWCVRMEQISWQKEMKISEYEAVKSAVAAFMDRMDFDKKEKGTIYYDKQSDEILYCTQDEALPIASLSAGYQSLIWLVFDIAYRMAVLNPFMKSDIASTAGIVLIDEIDLHLHPKWQWNVLNALHAVFPNVQFIVTTHSPIIIASTKGSWLLDIENEDTEYQYTHFGLDINDTLTISQGSQSLPEEVKKKVDDFYSYIDDEDLVNAEKVLTCLEKEVGTSIPVVVEARVCYDMERISHE